MSNDDAVLVTNDLAREISAFLSDKAWRYPGIASLLRSAHEGEQVTVGPPFPRRDLRARSTTLVSASLPTFASDQVSLMVSSLALSLSSTVDRVTEEVRDRYQIPPEAQPIVTHQKDLDSSRFDFSWWKIAGDSPIYTVGGDVSQR